jgi:protein AATF/BFR2
MSRLTLAQQLKQLEEEERPRTFDPEAAYTSLDSLEIGQRDGEEGREHYLDVGPSRLRAQRDENAATLLGDKYAGKSTGRMKIFDDDDDDDEEEEDNDEGGGIDGDDTRSEGDDAEESDEELDDEDEEDEEESDDEAQDEEDNEEDEEPEAAPKARAAPVTASKTRALDPLGSLREARQKDIEKGQGIRKQKVS